MTIEGADLMRLKVAAQFCMGELYGAEAIMTKFEGFIFKGTPQGS
jgi:hypothetical protein